MPLPPSMKAKRKWKRLPAACLAQMRGKMPLPLCHGGRGQPLHGLGPRPSPGAPSMPWDRARPRALPPCPFPTPRSGHVAEPSRLWLDYVQRQDAAATLPAAAGDGRFMPWDRARPRAQASSPSQRPAATTWQSRPGSGWIAFSGKMPLPLCHSGRGRPRSQKGRSLHALPNAPQRPGTAAVPESPLPCLTSGSSPGKTPGSAPRRTAATRRRPASCGSSCRGRTG